MEARGHCVCVAVMLAQTTCPPLRRALVLLVMLVPRLLVLLGPVVQLQLLRMQVLRMVRLTLPVHTL
jgi:hypothetical protein